MDNCKFPSVKIFEFQKRLEYLYPNSVKISCLLSKGRFKDYLCQLNTQKKILRSLFALPSVSQVVL